MRFLMNVLVAFSFCSSSAVSPAAEAGSVEWERDYAKAVAKAGRTGRPIFLVFR
jgi:hypothetical protein